MKYFFLISFFCLNIHLNAQRIKLKDSSSITFSGIVETYFSFDLNSTFSPEKAPYLLNYRHNREVNINFAMVKMNYQSKSTRANFGMMSGNYLQYNLASESEFIRNIYEANIGVKLSKKHDLWLDAGIMPSHIGYETMISQDNIILSKSMNGENTPYFESGVKIGYTTADKKWYLSGMILNGWQRIGRNSPLAFGTQITYKPNDKFSLNYSTFLGKMNVSEFRHYHNVYANIKFGKKWESVIGFDLGVQKLNASYGKPRVWYAPSITLRYLYNNHWSFAYRAEYYSDVNGVIMDFNNFTGLSTFGSSFEIDYRVMKYVLWRNECRLLASDKSIYYRKEVPEARANNYAFTTALVFHF